MKCKFFFILVATSLLLSCANPGIVKLSPDTYMLSRVDRGGIFGNAAAMKASVIQEANDFAARMGKIAIPLGTKETPMAIGQLATFEYQFRVVDKDDPEARRTSLVPRPDVVVEKTESSKVNVQVTPNETKNKDIYSELIKLDDLRKRGVLTDAEFEAEKKKILSQP